MKPSFLLLLAAFALPCAAQTPAQTASSQLAALAAHMTEREYDLDPVRETYTEGRGPHAGRATPPPTDKAREHERAVYREILDRLAKIPRTGLTETELNTHDLIGWRARNAIAQLDSRVEQMQILSPSWGYASGLIFLAASSQPLETEADFEAWLARVGDFAAKSGDVIVALEESRRAGWTTPRVLVEKALVQIDAIAGKPADQGPLWGPVTRYPKLASPQKRADFEKRYRDALDQRMIPAMKTLASYVREKYLPAARTTAGIGSLPGGDAAYRALVRIDTTLDLTPDEVHAIGLAEMERIRPKLLEVARGLGFKGGIKEFPAWIESNPANYPFKTPDEVLEYLRKVNARVVPGLPKLFKRMPKTRFDIRLTPPELAASASASYNSAPIDNSRPGYFNMPVVDARKIAVFGLADLLLHEGMPGHHLDSSLRRELDLPRFRRYSWITAYGEGWGLYAESLGNELGVYEDPWARLGWYAAELQRAARLVVDTGLHAKGWTREQGIKYLVEERGSFERAAVVEVERYMTAPGQALAYKIGEREILALRAQAQAALGKRFDLREFHEAVLGEGPLPLPLLRKRVEAWIARQLA